MGITSAEQKYTRLWREAEKRIEQLQAENDRLGAELMLCASRNSKVILELQNKNEKLRSILQQGLDYLDKGGNITCGCDYHGDLEQALEEGGEK